MQNEPLFENEIAFVLSDVPNGRAIARTFLVEKSDKYTLNQRIAGITPLSETDSYYLYVLMNRHPYFLAFDDGVKQTNLSVSDVMKFESYYPKYEEQETIGRYFSQLENLITLHQRKGKVYKYFFTIVWEQRKLGKEATEMVAGGDIDKNIILDKGNYPVIANALTNDGIVGYYDHEYRVKAPAVTVTGRGDVGHAKARNIDFTPVVRLLSLKTNHDVLFLENAINTLKIVVESTGVPQLTVPQLAKYEVYFPKKIEEEKKIGRYFKHLDHLITLHQWKYYFCEKNRINVWEQRKLGELGSVSMCRRIFKEQTSEKGDIPFYKIGTFGSVADAFISKELFEEYKSKYPYPKKGDILISASGSIGRTVEFTGKNEYFQDSNIVWLNHDERLSNAFLKCFYSIVNWTGIEGSTIKRLYNENILNTTINLPSIHEQNKIGDYFNKLDNLITLHQWKCNAYEKDRVIAEKQRKLEIILINLQKYTFLRVILVYKQWIIICIYYENILLRFYVVINVKVIFLFIIIFENIAIIYKLSCVFTIYYSHLFLFMYEINIIVMRVLILQNILFRKFTMNQVVIIKYLFTCAWFIIYYSKKHLKIIFAFVEIIILVTKER